MKSTIREWYELGQWAARQTSPAWDGASEEDIAHWLACEDHPLSGKESPHESEINAGLAGWRFECGQESS